MKKGLMKMDSRYRESEIRSKLNIAGFTPLDIMVTGVTGAGKSTTLNGFFEREVAKVGTGCYPETMDLTSFRFSDNIRLWDTPGLGDGKDRDDSHSKKMIELLNRTYTLDGRKHGFIDLVLVVIEGCNRDMGTTYKLLEQVIMQNIQPDRILIAINQADCAMKGAHWIRDQNRPDPVLQDYLNEQSLSICRRIRESTGLNVERPICYSAEHSYNIKALYDMIIDHIPVVRRPIGY